MNGPGMLSIRTPPSSHSEASRVISLGVFQAILYKPVVIMYIDQDYSMGHLRYQLIVIIMHKITHGNYIRLVKQKSSKTLTTNCEHEQNQFLKSERWNVNTRQITE